MESVEQVSQIVYGLATKKGITQLEAEEKTVCLCLKEGPQWFADILFRGDDIIDVEFRHGCFHLVRYPYLSSTSEPSPPLQFSVGDYSFKWSNNGFLSSSVVYLVSLSGKVKKKRIRLTTSKKKVPP